MKYTVDTTKRFDKDLKRCVKRGLPLESIERVINLLQEFGCVPEIYRPHKLVGSHHGEWECHIKPDWLLVWAQNDTELTLLMLRTGSHADIF